MGRRGWSTNELRQARVSASLDVSALFEVGFDAPIASGSSTCIGSNQPDLVYLPILHTQNAKLIWGVQCRGY